MSEQFTADFSAYLRRHQQTIELLEQQLLGTIGEAAGLLNGVLRNGGRVLVCGNGGSAADAQHFAAELVGRFVTERHALPAIALTTDSSILTAVGNDYGFNEVFKRQVEALGRPGDLVIGISTSGNSPNVALALAAARKQGCRTLGLLGRDGGSIAGQVDLALVIPGERTAHIQEAHLVIIHMLCMAVDREFAPSAGA